MELVQFLLDSWIVMAVLVAFVLAAWSSLSRAPYERGLQPICEERCSVQGQLSIFCRVSLYDKFMVVAFLGKARIFYSDIVEARCKKGLVSRGIYIKTRSGHWMFPSSIKFFPHHPEKFIEVLNTKVIGEHKE